MTQISTGFTDDERPHLAALYWEAFGAKLAKVLGPDPLALHFIAQNIDPDFALLVRSAHDEIIGVAGFKTSEGSFLGGDLKELAQVYGWLSTAWRAPLLGLVERNLADGVLLMDGICVSSHARGQGIGTALLEGIKTKARELGSTSVRLDVINTNPKARVLYERRGFRAGKVETLGPLKYVFGFSHSTQMVWST